MGCELNFWQKKDPLRYISLSALTRLLKYRIVYIDENFQAAITFNNLARYLDFGRDMK